MVVAKSIIFFFQLIWICLFGDSIYIEDQSLKSLHLQNNFPFLHLLNCPCQFSLSEKHCSIWNRKRQSFVGKHRNNIRHVRSICCIILNAQETHMNESQDLVIRIEISKRVQSFISEPLPSAHNSQVSTQPVFQNLQINQFILVVQNPSK